MGLGFMVLTGRGVCGWRGGCRYSLTQPLIIAFAQSRQKKLDIFHRHLKGLRTILQVPTTFVDRRYTHARVYELASQVAFPNKPTKRVTPFFRNIGWEASSFSRTYISWESFEASGARTGDSSSFNLGKRRVGRPRQSLTYNTNEFIRAMRRMI